MGEAWQRVTGVWTEEGLWQCTGWEVTETCSLKQEIFFFVCEDRVSLFNPGQPETHYLDQASPEFIEICLSLPSKC